MKNTKLIACGTLLALTSVCLGQSLAETTPDVYEIFMRNDRYGVDLSVIPAREMCTVETDLDDDGIDESLRIDLTEDATLRFTVTDTDGNIATAEDSDVLGISTCLCDASAPGNILNIFLYDGKIGVESHDIEALRGDGIGMFFTAFKYNGDTLDTIARADYAGSDLIEDPLFMGVLAAEHSSAEWDALVSRAYLISDTLPAEKLITITTDFTLESAEIFNAWENDPAEPLRVATVTIDVIAGETETHDSTVFTPTVTAVPAEVRTPDETGSAAEQTEVPVTAMNVIATASVNVRATPSLDGEKLGALRKGDMLEFLGEAFTDDRGVDWYKVSFEGMTAWISSRYAAFSGADTGSEEITAEQVVTTASVNVRAGAGKEWNVLGSVTKGTVLTYLGEALRDERGVYWYCVEYNGAPAWISSMYSELK